MNDLEKVIEALEACVLKDPDDSRDCKHCPRCNYGAFITNSCINGVMADCLSLLKAQEPIETRLHLCESCTKEYPECDATKDGVVFGSGTGNDNIIGCTAYVNRWKAQEPRLVTEADFENADEYGFIPVWCEETNKNYYWNCIPRSALETAKEDGCRYWTSKQSLKQMEETPWQGSSNL